MTRTANDQLVAQLMGQGSPYELMTVPAPWGVQQIFRRGPHTLCDLYREAASCGTKPFVCDESGCLSYDETLQKAAALAAVMKHRFAVGNGTRVAIVMRNSSEWIIAFIAVTSLGALAILVNSKSAADELQYAVRSMKCAVVLCDDNCTESFVQQTTAASVPLVIASGVPIAPAGSSISFADAIAGWRSAERRFASVDPEQPAAVMFTSGTTGRPKGAVLSQRSILHGIRLTDFGALLHLASNGKGFRAESWEKESDDRQSASLLMSPMFHISGCHHGFLRAMYKKQRVVLLSKWSAATAAAIIERERIAQIGLVPTMAFDLLKAVEGNPQQLASLEYIAFGGSSLPADVLEGIDAAVPGCVAACAYGSTETNGAVSLLSGEDLLRNPSSCGKVLPSVELRIVNESGRTVQTGEYGEVCIRGALVMDGYLDNPAANADVLRDGWFHTGDIGYLSESGYLHLIDRKKNMVISGGENIFCAEVERVLGQHPAIKEVVAFGMPDPRLVERLAVVVVPRSGAQLSAGDVISHATEYLARYKVPREVILRGTSLPLTPTGKVDKKALLDELLSARR